MLHSCQEAAIRCLQLLAAACSCLQLLAAACSCLQLLEAAVGLQQRHGSAAAFAVVRRAPLRHRGAACASHSASQTGWAVLGARRVQHCPSAARTQWWQIFTVCTNSQ